MTSLLPNVLVFAADIGDVITFLVAVFVGLASLMSFLKDKLQAGQQPDANRPRRPAPPKRDRNLQSEIDRFLQEVGGKSAKRPAEKPIEIIEVDESKRRTQQQAKPQPQTRQPEPVRSKPGSAIADREAPGSDDLGSSVRQHVSEHMAKELGCRPIKPKLTCESLKLRRKKPWRLPKLSNKKCLPKSKRVGRRLY